MITAADVLDRLVAIVAAVVPDQRYFGSSSFRLAPTYDSEDWGDQEATRIFAITPTGDREWTGWMGAAGSPIEIRAEYLLEVAYRQGRSPMDLLRVITQDVDRLTWALQLNSNYECATSGISRIVAESYTLDLDPTENGTALVSIPVEVQYKPTFTE
jgi:hypothetical protein